MKKKLIGALLIISCVSMLAACGGNTNEVSNKNDKQVTSEVEKTTKEEVDEVEPTEEPTPTETVSNDLPGIADLSAAMQNQFKDVKDFSMKMYISTNSDSYTDDDLYMAMAKGDNVSYTYIANFLEAYLVDDTIYYYDATKEQWFVDEYTTDDGSFEVTDEVDSIKDQTFPGNTVIELKTLNGTEYIAATYEDGDEYEQTTVTYYFDEDLTFIAAGSKMDDATEFGEAGYLFMTLDTNPVVLPDEVKEAEAGNYEEYVMNVFTSMYDMSEDNTLYTDEVEDTDVPVVEEETTEDDIKDKSETTINSTNKRPGR